MYDAANLEAMSAAVGYQAAMRQLVVAKLRLSTATEVVADFGAGRGDYASAIQADTRINVVAVEPDTTLHTYYPSSLKVTASLAELPRGVEAAYSLNVLEHIPDDAATLAAWGSHCKPGAFIFLLVPANPGLWTPMDTLVGHQRRYLPRTLRETVKKAGLQVIEEGWFDRTGYFATRAFQFLNLFRQVKPSGVVSKAQIKAFDALFRVFEPFFEALAIPFGKNCWVLARCPVPAKDSQA